MHVTSAPKSRKVRILKRAIVPEPTIRTFLFSISAKKGKYAILPLFSITPNKFIIDAEKKRMYFYE